MAKLRPAFAEGRHGDRRERVGHQRRGRGGRAGQRAFAEQHSLAPLGRLVAYSHAGVEPRIMGIGPGARHPQGAGPGRPQAGRHRRVRGQRGVRGAGTRGRPRTGAAAGEDQPERQWHLARASDRRHRDHPGREGALRAAPHRRPVRPGHDVHRRRPGHRRHLRADSERHRRRAGLPPCRPTRPQAAATDGARNPDGRDGGRERAPGALGPDMRPVPRRSTGRFVRTRAAVQRGGRASHRGPAAFRFGASLAQDRPGGCRALARPPGPAAGARATRRTAGSPTRPGRTTRPSSRCARATWRPGSTAATCWRPDSPTR